MVEQTISPEGRKNLHDLAEKRQRDAHGHFIDTTSPQPSPSPVSTTTQDPLDAPLVSVSINNPFKQMLHWLDDLRKKQTTEFDINTKLKIPLLAWAVVVGVIF